MVRSLRRMRPEGVVPVIDYDLLQVPPSVRQRLPLSDAVQAMEEGESEQELQQPAPKRRTLLQMITGGGRTHEEEDLSIPTFIRRQAD